MQIKFLSLASLMLCLLMACSSPIALVDPASGAARAANQTITGPNGTVTLSGMSGTSFTLSYTPSPAINSARLYVTQGNGYGLVLANQAMTNTGGTWSWTCSNASFTNGAKIGFDILQTRAGAETSVPQGTLGDATSWASFIFGSSVNTYTVSFDSQGATVAASPATKTVTSPATTIDALPTAPSKSGYSFGGWYTAVNGGGAAFTAATVVSANLTVYAKWVAPVGDTVTLTGANGTVIVSGMTNTSLTVSYTPAAAIDSARLFVTHGNGLGLILASQAMVNTAGTWSYTFSNASFTANAKIGLDVLSAAAGVEKNVPQGALADASTWASFNYASGNQTTSYTVSYDSQGATTAASPATQTVTSPATTVGSLPTAPLKTGYGFQGWFTAVNGGGSAFTSATPVSANLTVYASWKKDDGTLDFGPNVIIFDTTMSSATIQAKLDSIFLTQQKDEFSTKRYAIMFKPGTYSAAVNVGFYTQVMGLGRNVDDVLINGSIQADGSHDPNHNVTQNFWRSVENIAVAPSAYGRNMWAVSQAAPARRFHVKGDLWFFDINPANGASGWASGGFMADSWVDGSVIPGGQQQWLSRNSTWSSSTGGVWNMVFVGDNNAPATSFGKIPNYTTLSSTPVIKEKPYLYIDGTGAYQVFVPSMRTNSTGISWAAGSTPGTSLPISQFYVAKSANDTAASINAALASGKHLLLTPGVYNLNDTIRVSNANTIVLGLGMATLVNTTGLPAMTVADVDGVEVAGLLFDAGTTNTSVLMQVGASVTGTSHAANPILLADLFFRVGGFMAGKANSCLQINSADVIGDNFWIWRADHGIAGTWGWTANLADNGLTVNGANVTIYGLFVEHFQKYQTVWNGNGGKVYFYQSEIPYDVPNQAAWMNGSAKGYASFKVANSVSSLSAWGVGVYCFFNANPSCQLDSAIEVPASGLNGAMFHNMVTVALGTAGQVGQINHVINDQGAMTNDVGTPTYLTK